MTRLRVVFCIDNMEVGGTELNAVRTAERLDRSRFDLAVVSLRETGPLLSRYGAAGIPVHRFPIERLAGRRTLRQGVRLASFLRRMQADVFHAHDIYSNIFGVPWARAAGVPAIIASRRWWHGGEPRRGHQLANRLAYRFAHAVLTNAPSVARMVQDSDGVDESRIAVVPNFLDDRSFEVMEDSVRRRLLEELGVPAGARVVGSVANLRPVKDHATLLRAMAVMTDHDDVHVVLVGDGPCRSELERLAGELSIDSRVHFAGHRPNDPNLHGLFNISVLNSLSEASSNSILEAMAAGRPMIATQVGGSGDAVVDGKTGILVFPASPEALAVAIQSLLDDPPAARRMGEEGRRRARDCFTSLEALTRLERLYRRLVVAQSRVIELPSSLAVSPRGRHARGE